MSDDLLNAIRKDKARLQSPIDDLFSFYYVTQWAAVFNNREFTGNLRGQEVPFELSSLRSSLSEGVGKRSNVVMAFHRLRMQAKDYGEFLAQLKPFMAEWDNSLIAINSVWAENFESYASEPRKNPSETYLALYKEVQNQLVINTLKIAYKHLATFSKAEVV
jgi:hypothetical protein